MKVGNFKNILLSHSAGIAVLTVLTIAACVKPNNEELFPPVGAPSCVDGVLNQGEYYTDCGGPCAPCAVGAPSVSFQVDSTWLPDNPANKPMKSDFAIAYFSGNRIIITAADTFANIGQQVGISFSFPDSLGLGTHVVKDPMANEKFLYFIPNFPPGQATLEYGIITITNRDEVNKLISGEFKYTCEPDEFTGYRVAIYNGIFKDIPSEIPTP